ncbi:MAG: ketol-acid reductoisomerase [Methanosarcinaceae archaeon]|nr:ketol-acid reductoisomerase [Methanosarcinaceae archaeon]
MAEMFYENDVEPGVLSGKKIAVIGYGSQGRAQALNLKDSGLDVVVGVRPGKSSNAAVEDGMVVKDVASAVESADIVHILLPDEAQSIVYKKEIEPNLKKGASISFSHGFNIHYNQIIPREDLDVFLVAPKGPGHTVRETFTQGIGVPGLIAIYQDATGNAMKYAKSFAKGIGCMRAGVYVTTFKEETETDLFGEQVDLCGGISALIKASFEVLVDAGYQPEMAYFETVHEVKLIVDLIHEGGLERMWDSVSNTAEYGGMTVGPSIINEESVDAMYIALDRIQNGQFAKEFILEGLTNYTVLRAMERLESEHLMETVGKEIRSNIPWLADKNKKTKK